MGQRSEDFKKRKSIQTVNQNAPLTLRLYLYRLLDTTSHFLFTPSHPISKSSLSEYSIRCRLFPKLLARLSAGSDSTTGAPRRSRHALCRARRIQAPYRGRTTLIISPWFEEWRIWTKKQRLALDLHRYRGLTASSSTKIRPSGKITMCRCGRYLIQLVRDSQLLH